MRALRNGMGIGLALALVVGVLGGTSASAQIYPQPDGYCVISLSDPLPELDSEITLTITAADRGGTPLEGVDGVLQIIDQPGKAAHLEPAQFVTKADGTAEVILYTGQETGLIRITGPCDAVEVMANVPVGSPPGPPATGSGLLDDNRVVVATMGTAGVLAVVGSLGITMGVLRKRA